MNSGVQKKNTVAFMILPSTVSTIMKHRESVKKNNNVWELVENVLKTCKYNDIDEAVYKWMKWYEIKTCLSQDHL